MIDNELEYEVEEILNSCISERKFHYLVKWKGYPMEESTWESVENLKGSDKLVKEFHYKHWAALRQLDLGVTFIPYENLHYELLHGQGRNYPRN